MKRSLIVLLIGLVTFSCQEKEPRTDYVINGTAKDVYNGIRVYLGEFQPRRGFIAKDTAIVMNETFSFKGSVDNPTLFHLKINGVNGTLPLMIENSEMNLTADKNNILNSQLEGSESNSVMVEFNTTVNDNKEKLRLLYQNYEEAKFVRDSVVMESDLDKIKRMNEITTNYPYEFIEDNNDNYAVLEILENLLRQRNMDIERLVNSFDNLTEDLKNSKKGQTLNNQMNSLKLRIEAEKATAIGAKAPAFSAPNPDGEQIALSDVVSKGKVTIVDFWAAWCGPCRRENPNVVKVYEEFHDKGLEIIGVSLDGRRGQKEPKQAWIDAIEKDGLTWHQVSNLRYFDELARSYNVNAIPAMFVLDENGIIVAKNLRGQMLRNKIAELLN
ncbi:redoxin domain-containing protein [Winogradskyella sp. A3E31]|uniref:redoxin domain-containing protein n=1 Tax=Winogradskyella sp. A3E31 TaxID=3349637 RepID=UPI00398B770A